ncbi:ABC transporter substrate-binding protein [Pelomonas sp. KK5]|uniref:substrate-binding periplasmic protein n=1 Tax=Pelomonas sp. KK5 TaxID=1855730 RepID=UPI00097BD335|nr:transporter substrate-binding domain-containing protein [Pelomonas sp. KK5]
MSRLLVLCLSLLLLPVCASAAPQQTTRPVLVLAFTELAPWLTHEGPSYTGAYTEIVRELARRVDHRLEIEDCPLKRCLVQLQRGTADLIIGLRQTPERALLLQFLQTPYRLAVADRVFIVRSGESARIQRYDDLLGPRIGVAPGSSYFTRFDADHRLAKESAPSNEINLQKLLLGRIDAVPMPEDQALVLIHRLKLEHKVEPARYRVSEPSSRSIAVSRASVQAMVLLPKLEAAMQAMRRDGTLAAIYAQHYYRRYGVGRQQIKVE